MAVFTLGEDAEVERTTLSTGRWGASSVRYELVAPSLPCFRYSSITRTRCTLLHPFPIIKSLDLSLIFPHLQHENVSPTRVDPTPCTTLLQPSRNCFRSTHVIRAREVKNNIRICGFSLQDRDVVEATVDQTERRVRSGKTCPTAGVAN